MIRSRAELAAHLMRAARGAGVPLAIAEDLYTSARFLTADDVAWVAEDLSSGGAELVRIVVDLDVAQCEGQAPDGTGVAAALAQARGLIERTCPTEPVAVSDRVWDLLNEFAAKTYVPETAQSRARGAGAGDIDND